MLSIIFKLILVYLAFQLIKFGLNAYRVIRAVKSGQVKTNGKGGFYYSNTNTQQRPESASRSSSEKGDVIDAEYRVLDD